ncbi:FAD-binding protein (plasmid) [Azospirillum oryzae]|uniref:FAD-binding protein n=1 Tax=Azospirillum oryzae TaxID=286727 RepID=A0A6N1AXT8_9PROT|nr:FAD-binding protein [Azospirillum oryzae]KAA0587848.1 FAD-binding protein [Azospirillum oryzae]QKS53964.1 FAD-binding protein [Azospirillum oryzae]GLR77763.1 succinate dehydrogenase flavoprotein subunit [Azospirillum oryzae]
MATLPIGVERVKTDVVVVGGGGAASRAALSARQAGADVRLVAKAPLKSGGSTVHGASEIMSMGAAGFGDGRDNPTVHYDDTMRAGRGFIDPELVRVLAEDAPGRIRDLMELGVRFDRAGADAYKLIRSDFGSYARAMGVSGKTGHAFVQAIAERLTELGVVVDAPVMLVDLVRGADGAVAGVLAYDPSRRVLIHYEAPAVVLGTGGMHGAFERQVSTAEMTGDGQAICFRHGAELVNLEFHQFGPALIHPYVQLFSKSCFVLHPRITNAEGVEFLPSYLPDGVTVEEVQDEKVFPFTTTNVSRHLDIAIAREVDAGRGTPHGGVYFSFAHVAPDRIAAVIPNTARWMRQRGLDVQNDRFEVGIAFQCMNGGVRMTNADAESTIPGLYVVGELAGGVRGPDRPGGNSLAEGQVFGHRAGAAAARRAAATTVGPAATLTESLDGLAQALATRPSGMPDLVGIEASVRRAMQRHCLVEKSAEGLDVALATVREAQAELDGALGLTPDTLLPGLSLRNLVQSSELVLRACRQRAETRSGHYRVDHPETDDAHYLGCFVWTRDGDAAAMRTLTY